jgi:hypothetical protein
MKFPLLFIFFSIPLVSCTVPKTNYLYLGGDEITNLNAELDVAESSLYKAIKLFPRLKEFFNYHQFLKDYQYEEFFSVLSRYYSIIRSHFTKSPIECLQTTRLYGNLEFTFLSTDYIKSNAEVSSFKKLVEGYQKLKWGFHDAYVPKENIIYCTLANYRKIAQKILLDPFIPNPKTNSEIVPNSKTSPKVPYNAGEDWEERRKIIEEIILSLKSLYKSEKYSLRDVATDRRIKRRIEEFQVILEKFQVDSNGPCIEHFVSTFYQLRFFVQNSKSYGDLPSIAKNLLSLFRIYCKHLEEYQFIDPSLFPKPMLAIVHRDDLYKSSFFWHFRLSNNRLIQNGIVYLRREQLSNIYERKRLLYSKNRKIVFSLSEWGSTGNWLNLLNLPDILSLKEKWIINAYEVLLRT